MLRVALVGLANVGKSSLFNALAGRELAEAANFPFCTIEPNEVVVNVPDPRLQQLAALSQSQRVVQTQLQLVDVAGLVAGARWGSRADGHVAQIWVWFSTLALFLPFQQKKKNHIYSEGKGLGTMFLGHIRETHAIIHVGGNIEKKLLLMSWPAAVVLISFTFASVAKGGKGL